MEGSRATSIIQLISSPDGIYIVDSIIGTKVLHELYVARASLLMVTRLGSTWAGKSSPFCLVWVVNRAVAATSSIEEMFCSIVSLLAIVDDELWYKSKLPRIELRSSEQPSRFVLGLYP